MQDTPQTLHSWKSSAWKTGQIFLSSAVRGWWTAVVDVYMKLFLPNGAILQKTTHFLQNKWLHEEMVCSYVQLHLSIDNISVKMTNEWVHICHESENLIGCTYFFTWLYIFSTYRFVGNVSAGYLPHTVMGKFNLQPTDWAICSAIEHNRPSVCRNTNVYHRPRSNK